MSESTFKAARNDFIKFRATVSATGRRTAGHYGLLRASVEGGQERRREQQHSHPEEDYGTIKQNMTSEKKNEN
jgi:hypothetical protein